MHLRKSLFINPRLLLCSPIFLSSLSFQFIDKDVRSYWTWNLLDSLYYLSFYVLDLFIMGVFYVPKNIILLDVVIEISVGPAALEYICI